MEMDVYPQHLPAGAGFEKGEEGAAGQEDMATAYPTEMPAGGGFKAGEEGKAGEENRRPEGELPPEHLWGTEGESTAPGGTVQNARGVCWLEAPDKAAATYKLKGSIQMDSAGAKTMALIAVDRPLSKWKDGSQVQIFDVATTTSASFDVELKADTKGSHVCAIGPADHNQVQHIQVGGCFKKSLKGKSGAVTTRSDVNIPISPLPQGLLLIGKTANTAPAAQGAQTPRIVQGKVQSPGVENGGFFVMAAPEPILDQEESQGNPSAYSFVDDDGSFQFAYLANPTDPLFLCALGLPMNSEDGIAAIEGQGCTRVQVPSAPGPSGAYEVVGASVTVNPEKMPLAPHEQKYLQLLRRCSPAGS
tara:strand:+ start:67 stop:1149 length:1083 start_codon:yes stop_codon:yes gene_type:complete